MTIEQELTQAIVQSGLMTIFSLVIIGATYTMINAILKFFKVRLVSEKKLQRMISLLEIEGYTPSDLKTA